MIATNHIRIQRAPSPAVVGGVQLLRNTDFAESIPQFRTMGEIDARGKWTAWRATPTANERILEFDGYCWVYQDVDSEPNTDYTLSCQAKCESELRIYIMALTEAGWAQIASTSIGDDSVFARIHLTAKPSTSRMRVIFANSNTDKAWITRVKLERGTTPTDWSLHTDDSFTQRMGIYASEEGGTMESGVMLSRLMCVGQTDKQGNFAVKAGINGVTAPRDGIVFKSSPIAFWAGGKPIDHVENPSDCATMVQRHDGTGYWCGGDIRFEQNRLEIGDSLWLDADGLTMFDSEGGKRLRIVNSNVNDYISNIYSEYCLKSVDKKLYIGTAKTVGINRADPIDIPIGNVESGRTVYISQAKIATNIPSDLPEYIENTIAYISLCKAGIPVATAQINPTVTNEQWIWAFPDIQITATSTAQYSLQVLFADLGSTQADTYEIPMRFSATCRVEASSLRQTIIANDGFMTAWGSTQVLAREGEITLAVAGKGIKITANGIEYL